MKNIKFLSGLAVVVAAGLSLTGCKKDLGNNFDRSANAGILAVRHIPTTSCGQLIDNVDGNATDHIITLTSTDTWLLDSITYVQPGYTLRIPAGTRIISGDARTYSATDPITGTTTTKSIKGVLVVTKGGKLESNGTAANPVVFTSANAAGSRKAGDFGGIILLGRARTNWPDSTATRIEGLPTPGCGLSLTYGRQDATKDNDNSGSITYTRIEYPGLKLFNDNEINGLTLGGVGSGTTLDHIQVSYSADDSFEFFGGKVNATYLVAAGGDDDDFDFDNGYTGTINFAVGLKAVNSSHSKSSSNPLLSDANGIESDNNAAGTSTSLQTRPALNHFTLLGFASSTTKADTLKNNARLRRITSYNIQNSLLGGYPIGIAIENSSSGTLTNNLLHAYTAGGSVVPNSTVTSANSYLQLGSGTSTSFYAGPTSANYTTYSFNPDVLIPNASSPAGTTVGAIPSGTTAGSTWLAGWTDFNPQN
ncbi:hypothetical protein GCM10023149_15550 [Mucilaginibacter gynuensis]|uniref:Uncharacterized protein n=1 Tax=Mucilaginibacter gynuensis TaxID=1302236 RepID=A0ABP8G5E2_9SPHI